MAPATALKITMQLLLRRQKCCWFVQGPRLSWAEKF